MNTLVAETTATLGVDSRSSHFLQFGQHASAATTIGMFIESPWASTKQRIDDWAKDPSALRDSDLTPPSAIALERSMAIAEILREQGLAPPTRVVPDGDGGIAFERDIGETLVVIEVSAEGAVELLTFHSGKLINRR